MLLGMGIVFTFLIVLVFALNGMSRLAGLLEARHGTLKPDAAAPSAVPVTPGAAGNADGEIVAVISAAIARFRATKR